MSYYGDQTDCEILYSVGQFEIGQAGYLLARLRSNILITTFLRNYFRASSA